MMRVDNALPRVDNRGAWNTVLDSNGETRREGLRNDAILKIFLVGTFLRLSRTAEDAIMDVCFGAVICSVKCDSEWRNT